MDFIKDKDRLYRLIISQLTYDGYNQVAKLLSQAFRPDSAIIASDELARFYRSAIDAGVKVNKDIMAPHTDAQQMTQHQVSQSIDFEFESDVTIVSPEASTYKRIKRKRVKLIDFSFGKQIKIHGKKLGVLYTQSQLLFSILLLVKIDQNKPKLEAKTLYQNG